MQPIERKERPADEFIGKKLYLSSYWFGSYVIYPGTELYAGVATRTKHAESMQLKLGAYFANNRLAFVPPKPNEFVSTARSTFSCGWFGT